MIPITPQSRYDALVKLREGKIGREIFSDREIYEEELERVFTRAWLFVGHESQVPNPGDFFTSRMGAESVILARGSKNLHSHRHTVFGGKPEVGITIEELMRREAKL